MYSLVKPSAWKGSPLRINEVNIGVLSMQEGCRRYSPQSSEYALLEDRCF